MSVPGLKIRLVAPALVLSISSPLSWAQVDASVCGDLGRTQWDYRFATQAQHNEVEGAHFVPKVENLISGKSGPLGGDLNYTLKAVPNHHRALVSIMRWSKKLKLPQLPAMPLPVECYFERGIRFKADDHIVRMLYAQFLIDQARPAEAAKQLEQVARMAGDNGFTLYNIGLLYSDMKDYGQALTYAHKAMTLGFSRPELRQQLESAGRWTEPAAENAEPVASAPSPASAASAASAPIPRTN